MSRLSDVKIYIDKTQDALKMLAIKDHWFEKEKFKKLKLIAADQTSSLHHLQIFEKTYYLNGMNLKRMFISTMFVESQKAARNNI